MRMNTKVATLLVAGVISVSAVPLSSVYAQNLTVEQVSEMSSSFISSGTVYNGVDYSAVYDYEYYKANNSDVAQAYGDDEAMYIAHFVNFGMAEGRQADSDFNLAYYKANNSDVVQAYGNDNAMYYLHYMNFGKAEGRKGNGVVSSTAYNGVDYSAVYDYEYYKSHNTDVAQAYGDDEAMYIAHFVNFGMAEGRQGSSDFNLAFYKANNSDVTQAYGNDNAMYYLHYVNFGKSEGRQGNGIVSSTTYNGVDYSAVYDYEYYKSHNTDVAQAYGDDEAMYIAHFVNFGMAEGRQGNSDFNLAYYKANNSDVAQAYGNDNAMYYLHYVNFGKSEGRVADKLVSKPSEENKKDEDNNDEFNLADFDYTTDSNKIVALNDGVITDNSIYILGYHGTATDVTIPTTINGKVVTYVDFTDSNNTVKSLKLGDGVKQCSLTIPVAENIDFGNGMENFLRGTFNVAPNIKTITIGAGVKNFETNWCGTSDVYYPYFTNAILNINKSLQDVSLVGTPLSQVNDIKHSMNYVASPTATTSFFAEINFK